MNDPQLKAMMELVDEMLKPQSPFIGHPSNANWSPTTDMTAVCVRCGIQVDISEREHMCLCGCEGNLCDECDIDLNYE